MKRNFKRVVASAMAVAAAFALVLTSSVDADAEKNKKKDKKTESSADANTKKKDKKGKKDEKVPEVDLDGTYHGYLCLQTAPHYTFRDAYDHEQNGFGTEFFEQVTMWDDSQTPSVAAAAPGEIHDVEIAGNGTYSVSITGMELDMEESWNQIFLSTDIPVNDTIKITNMSVIVDGSTKHTWEEPIINPESKTYTQAIAQSIYNADVKAALDPATVPLGKDVELKFDISGFNYDNTAATGDAAAGDDATAGEEGTSDDGSTASDDSSSSSTDSTDSTTADSSSDSTSADAEDEGGSFPVVPVAVAVVVVVVIVVVVVATKKKQ